METIRAVVRSSAVLRGVGGAAGHAAAPARPERPVRGFVPWAPGGSTDIVARLLAAEPSVRPVADFIALADRRPGEINYPSSGIGGLPQLVTVRAD